MNRGYIKFWRKAQDSSSWNRGLMYQGLIINLLTRAAWKKGSYQGRDILPGQFSAIMSRLAESLDVPRSTLQRMVAHLEADDFIKVENVGNRFVVITIVNWSIYQESEKESRATDGQPMVDHRATDGQPYMEDARDNEIKEVKKEEEEEEKEYTNVYSSADAEAPADTPVPDGEKSKAKSKKPDSFLPPCPHQKIIALYHEILPELPAVRGWNDSRAKTLNARWKESLQRLRKANIPCTEESGLDWWRQFLQRIRAAPHYLHGFQRKDGSYWRPPGLAWFLAPEKFLKIIEGGHLDNRRIAA